MASALMQRAQERAAQPGQDTDQEPGQGQKFRKPDPSTFVPKGQEDAVERVVAAGMKTMYAPEMRDELVNEINRDVPVPQKMAEGVVGLVLTLDKQTQGGLPEGAIFPSILMLLAEAAELLTSTGQPVTQADYNEAAQIAFVLYGRAMKVPDDQIMSELQKRAGGGGEAAPDAAQVPAGAPPDGRELEGVT